MINPQDIQCWAFSYEEIETILKKHCPDGQIDYDGGGQIWINQEQQRDIPVIEVLHQEYPQIPQTSICFYTEIGYIYTKKEAQILVINGVQE